MIQITNRQQLYEALCEGQTVQYKFIDGDEWHILDASKYSVYELLNFKVLGYWDDLQQAEFRINQ